jgi:hypothetical protein
LKQPLAAAAVTSAAASQAARVPFRCVPDRTARPHNLQKPKVGFVLPFSVRVRQVPTGQSVPLRRQTRVQTFVPSWFATQTNPALHSRERVQTSLSLSPGGNWQSQICRLTSLVAM